VTNESRPEFFCSISYQVIKSGAGDVVGVGRQHSFDGSEVEVHLQILAMDERDTGFVHRDCRDAFFEIQIAQIRNDGGHKRLADQKWRTFFIIKDHHGDACFRKQRREGATGWAGSDDGDGFRFHRSKGGCAQNLATRRQRQ
jgi:hypothetical protein